MEKIVKRINATIQTVGCNLKCEYCFFSQANYVNKGTIKALRYPLQTILDACSKKRLGGQCAIQLMGDGETLLPDDVVALILGLLKEGHYVRVINNGTLSNRIHELIKLAESDGTIDRLSMIFSLHFLELEKRNLLNVFADNVDYVKKRGCSFEITLVACDEYIEAAERINQFCAQNLGGVTPWVQPADKYDTSANYVGVFSKYDRQTYFENIKKAFPSFQTKFAQEKIDIDNHKFCYAGDWFFYLDFTTGRYSQCMRNAGPEYNFFEHLEDELMLEPVGTRCKATCCICGGAKTFNLIPEENGYEEIQYVRNGSHNKYVSEKILRAYNTNLAETNKEYTKEEKTRYRKKQLQQEYFTKQVELLRFDFKEEKYEEFIEEAERILETDLNPRLLDVVWLVVMYGYALIRAGEIQRALDLESCWNDLEYNADYCYVMGLIYMKNGMIEKAILSFSEALKKNFVLEKGVNDYLAHYNLGVIYECIGQTENARKHYIKSQSYEPARKRLTELNKKKNYFTEML